MALFRAIVFAASIAGLAVGLMVAGLQRIGTVPLIAQGETYEKAAPAAPATHDHGAAAHEHEAAAWEPEGLERTLLTVLFDVVERTGWALALAGAMVVSGRTPTWREGFLWGLAGFTAFVLAPSLGLPPELPGIPAAPVGPRQIWWVATAACTAGGLWLIAFRPNPLAAIAAIALMAAPHLVGAPVLEDVKTTVPEALSHRFVVVVTLTTFLAWSLIGALTGGLLGRLAGPDEWAGPRRDPVSAGAIEGGEAR